MFEWVAVPAQILLDQLLEKWATWEKCRRWYKWLSIIQLVLAYVMLFTSGALFHAGVVLLGVGACCYGTGEAMGHTNWFNVDAYGNVSYSHTQDDGELCKIVARISAACGWGCLIGCFACYGLSWFFLASTFIFMYEEIDLTAEVEYFVLLNDKKYPHEMNLYPQMDRKCAKVGTVKRTDIVVGRKVYTGWIKLELNGPDVWLYCNRRGKMIFQRFPTEEEARLFCQQQIDASTTEVEGVPIVYNAPAQPIGAGKVVPVDTTAENATPQLVEALPV